VAVAENLEFLAQLGQADGGEFSGPTSATLLELSSSSPSLIEAPS
jgi:hypothetical protein